MTILSSLKSSLSSLSLTSLVDNPTRHPPPGAAGSAAATGAGGGGGGDADAAAPSKDDDGGEKDDREVRIRLPARRQAGSSFRAESSLVARWSQVRVTNWAETVEAGVDRFRYPRTVDEVVELVRENDQIRCSGALHSCAPLIASSGIILSLTRLDEILAVDPETRIVRMQAGVRIHDLCERLSQHELAVGTLGTIDWQTIAGAVMTGTHGGALTVPSLHEFVRSYTLVLPDGTMKKVEKATSPSLFRAMAPSMGLFGAVVEMEMEAVPLQILEAKMIAVPLDDVIPSFDRVMKENKYARIVIYPSIKRATIWTANPVSSREAAVANGAANNEGYTNFRNGEEKAMLEEYLELCHDREYDRADEVLERVLESQLGRLGHYVGQYNHVLCLERNNGIPHADIEMNFSYDKYADVLAAAFSYTASHRIPYYNFEIRTTARDDAYLSCCHSRPGLWIDFQAKADVSKHFFGDMTALLRPFGLRKHWAKGMDTADPSHVAEQFPDAGQFVRAVRAIDPRGKFRNEQGQSWYEALGLLTGMDKVGCDDDDDDDVPVTKKFKAFDNDVQDAMYAREA